MPDDRVDDQKIERFYLGESAGVEMPEVRQRIVEGAELPEYVLSAQRARILEKAGQRPTLWQHVWRPVPALTMAAILGVAAWIQWPAPEPTLTAEAGDQQLYLAVYEDLSSQPSSLAPMESLLGEEVER